MYLSAHCFLVPLSAAREERHSQSEPKTRTPLALMAAFIAGIRLARVESEEIVRQSPRVRAALSDSLLIAKALIQSKELDR